MNAPIANRLQMIDSIVLTPLVRKALKQDDVVVVDWKYDTLQGGSFNSEIYRFAGSAQRGDNVLPWSLILKVIRSPDGTDDPTSLNYWKREALAHQSGLLDNLPGGSRAPQCFGIVEQPGLEIWLWLEEIVNETPANWTLEQYGTAAYHLGQFNGAFLEQRSLLSQPWLATGRLRTWVADAISVIPVSADVLAHPLVSRFYPADIYERLLRVWSEHETWVAFIEHQPQTLAHLDAFRRNLFVRHDGRGQKETVLIDWSFVGSAAVGEEIAPLVAASLNFLDIDSNQAGALDETVFARYLQGLRETGWQGEPQVVRFTYIASAILRYGVGVIGVTSMVADDKQHALLERIFGHPLKELVDVWSNTNRFLYDLADEARGLLRSLR
jgi:hypothetical protein